MNLTTKGLYWQLMYLVEPYNGWKENHQPKTDNIKFIYEASVAIKSNGNANYKAEAEAELEKLVGAGNYSVETGNKLTNGYTQYNYRIQITAENEAAFTTKLSEMAANREKSSLSLAR